MSLVLGRRSQSDSFEELDQTDLRTDTEFDILWIDLDGEGSKATQELLAAVGAHRDRSRMIGVAKTYISRVGTGPFPTELTDETGDAMIELGGEYGTVTGRRRRCGWLDMVALRYSHRVNTFTSLFLTKLDILSAFDTIKVANAYSSGGTRYDEFPMQQSVLYHCEPEYEELPGWNTDITGVREFSELPDPAQDYIRYIEEIADVPVGWVSVGPERSQLITLK